MDAELVRVEAEGERSASLWVRAQPGAKRSGPCGVWNGHWKLALRAPAEGGRANEELVELLAELLGLRARELELAAGARSRSKRVRVPLSAEELRARIARARAD